MRRSIAPIGWPILAGALMLIVGSVGSWADVAALPAVTGTGGSDGWFGIFVAVVSAAFVVGASRAGWRSRRPGVVVSVLAALTVLVVVVDLTDIDAFAGPTGIAAIIEPGWGIYLALLGALVLLGGGLAAALAPPGGRSDERATAPAARSATERAEPGAEQRG